MNLVYETGNSLQHHGVKGMKWGVRKAMRSLGGSKFAKRAILNNKNLTVDQKRKALKEHEELADEKAYKKAKRKSERTGGQITYDVATRTYSVDKPSKKSVTESFKKPMTKEQAVKAVNTGRKIVGKLIVASVADDVFLGGAGKKVAKATVKQTGRAIITAYTMARGGYDIHWYDN